MARTAHFYNAYTGSLNLLNKPDGYFTDPNTPNVKKSPRWYTKESDPSFYEPRILVCSVHNRNKDIQKELHIGKDTTVFGDSGGFQLATGKIKESEWTRKIALDWSEANANLFPILDMPVSGKSSDLRTAIKYTAESAKYYVDHRSRSDRQILNVLSVNDTACIDQWYNGVKEYKLDGWCVGGHLNNLIPMLRSIHFLADKGEFDTEHPRPLHIFGTTSMGIIPYLVYVQHILNKRGVNVQLSFDSSSASAMVNYGNYIHSCNPNAMENKSVSNRYKWDELPIGTMFGCDCPVCSDIDNIKYLFSDEGKGQFYSLIGIHNYYKMLQYKRLFDGYISFDDKEILSNLSEDAEVAKEFKHNFKTLDKAFDTKGELGNGMINQLGLRRTKKSANKTTSIALRDETREHSGGSREKQKKQPEPSGAAPDALSLFL